MKNLLAAVLAVLIAGASYAANDTQWDNGPGAGDSNSKCSQLMSHGQRCYWWFDTGSTGDAANNSPVLNHKCPRVHVYVNEIAVAVVHIYRCPRGSTWATDCDRVSWVNASTGAYEAVVLSDDADSVGLLWWNALMMDVSGDGEVIVECREG